MAASVYPCEQGFHAPAPRDHQARSEFGERLQNEAPLVEARVRNGQSRLVDLLVAVEEKVEIQGPGRVLPGTRTRPKRCSTASSRSRRRARRERRLERPVRR